MNNIFWSDFNLAGVSSVCAVFFTNPMEVIKTRIQLQGELAARGTYVKPYTGVIPALITVAKHDGLLALQKGLVPAMYFQYILNACRLSIFDLACNAGLTKNPDGSESVSRGFFYGWFGGMVGSVTASPFFLIKTHLQSQANTNIAVGHQHQHQGMLHAIRGIVTEHGIRGLYRGASGTIPRSIGSATQLSSFSWAKDFMDRKNLRFESSAMNSFVASIFAGFWVSIAITPPDVVLTRLYNQPTDAKGKGLMYSGYVDCVVKILKKEGPLGFYKGFWPNYLRLAPHSTLVLLFYDEIKLFRTSYWS